MRPVALIDIPVVDELLGAVHDEGQAVRAGEKLGGTGRQRIVAIGQAASADPNEYEADNAGMIEDARALLQSDTFRDGS
ncbi:hypothetical protein WR25_03642 [Diploscapter pachys]|uniref:Uncharacterized protein n=1 Tax=Diploscapter pachys TaxID=2018661 RepID=A0A2A2KN52_9BILA|nr:hypothetical protein WR25_03642 [Diploscapter pachys]